jgi:RNA polymerase sigma factor (sigma-70 family)
MKKQFNQIHNNQLAINKDVEELIKYNREFIRSFARRYSTEYLDDLISECNIAILTAVESFDSTKGINFLSWARIYMKKVCTDFIDDQSKTIRLPKNWRYVDKFKDKLELESSKPAISINSPINEDLTVEDTLTDYIDEQPRYKENITKDHINKYISKLSSKQQIIIKMMFGINEEQECLTISETAQKLDITKQLVSFHHQNALIKLKEMMNHLK